MIDGIVLINEANRVKEDVGGFEIAVYNGLLRAVQEGETLCGSNCDLQPRSPRQRRRYPLKASRKLTNPPKFIN